MFGFMKEKEPELFAGLVLYKVNDVLYMGEINGQAYIGVVSKDDNTEEEVLRIIDQRRLKVHANMKSFTGDLIKVGGSLLSIGDNVSIDYKGIWGDNLIIIAHKNADMSISTYGVRMVAQQKIK